MSEFWLWFFAIIGIISCVLALLLILASLMPPETESPSDEKIAQKQKEALDTIESSDGKVMKNLPQEIGKQRFQFIKELLNFVATLN